jgi:hypothetical protein
MCDNPTTNPAHISILPNTIVNSSCNAHATFFQQVKLSFKFDMSDPFVTFVGSGEGVTMKPVPPSGTRVNCGNFSNIFVEFSFSVNGAPFELAPRVCSGGLGNFVTLFSEDAVDDDNNDSYLVIFLQAASSGSDYK